MSRPLTIRRVPGVMLRKTVINNSVLSAWCLWSTYALSSLAVSGRSEALFSAYLLYAILGASALWLARKDVLAPCGAFTLVGFAGFGLNIPLIATGHLSFIHISDATLSKVVIVLDFAQVAFMCGALLPVHRYRLLGRLIDTENGSREVGAGAFVLLGLVQVAAALLRMQFHLGEAGIQPTIPLAGYLQYGLYDGVLVLSVWFLVQGLTQRWVHVVLGLGLLLGMAITEAFLGWRGGIISVTILAAVAFWYQWKLHGGQRKHSMVWLVILVLLSTSVIQMANAMRAERLGGDIEFAKSGDEFVSNVLTRSQGTTRLAEVVDFFGPLSITNNFLIEQLISQGISATVYIDTKLYSIKESQSHSIGTSGPGGPYTAMGLIGVFGSYLLMGMMYRASYMCICNLNASRRNPFGIVLHTFMILLMFEILNENFSINTVKKYLAVIVQTYVIKLVLQRRGVTPQ